MNAAKKYDGMKNVIFRLSVSDHQGMKIVAARARVPLISIYQAFSKKLILNDQNKLAKKEADFLNSLLSESKAI